MDCEYVYNHLTSVLFSLEDVDFIILGGDFNAKIGDKVDFIPDIDVIPERVVLDNSNNKHGESFIDFLLANKMCVINGRIMQGKDNFTYITPKGKSVIDYFVTSMEGLKYCKELNILSVRELLDDMQIIPDCAIPDHSILLLDLDMTELTPIDNLFKEKDIDLSQNIYNKKFFTSDLPTDFMLSDYVSNQIDSLIRYMGSTDPSQCVVNQIYEIFIQLHQNEMIKKLPIRNNSKASIKKKVPFWNDNLEALHRDASLARKQFIKHKKRDGHYTLLRCEYQEKQNSFDKSYRKAKRLYVRQRELALENMVGKQGRELWKSLENIGPSTIRKSCRIPEEVIINGIVVTEKSKVLHKWASDFALLYKGSDDSLEYQKRHLVGEQEIKNNSNIDDLDLTFLNNPITVTEVKDMTKQIKRNKAISVDQIPNEVLKNESSIRILTDLYNYFYQNDIIPEKCRQSLIQPVYKGGNKSKNEPLNYRPISLFCNPCKGLSIILNERLKKIINKKELLVEEQNGFRKGRSCLDHVFVLTSVIQSRIRRNLYSAVLWTFPKRSIFWTENCCLKLLNVWVLGANF